MTLERLRREMSYREYRLWIEAYNREPWGETRGDWQMAQMCSTVASSVGASVKPAEFMPDFDREEAEQTPEDHKAMMMRWTAALNRRT